MGKYTKKILTDKSVAVLIETEYIREEVEKYEKFFTDHGAKVDFLTYLHGQKSRKIICDSSDTNETGTQMHTMVIDKEIAASNPDDYAIILIGASYVARHLRDVFSTGYIGSVLELGDAPVIKFMKKAMKNPRIVKGALCHSLWLLTSIPELLNGRRIICHTVTLVNEYDTGAIFIPEESHVVVDNDLVTGLSIEDLDAYCQAVLDTYFRLNRNSDLA